MDKTATVVLTQDELRYLTRMLQQVSANILDLEMQIPCILKRCVNKVDAAYNTTL